MRYLLLFLLSITFLNAAPAREVTRHYIQSDGSSLYATQHGDEYLHWLQTQDGAVVIYNNKTSNYDYAQIEQNTLKASGEVYSPDKRKSRSITILNITKLWEKKREEERQRRLKKK